MKETLTAKTQMTIHANASQVWEALTKPELIKQYMMGADAKSRGDGFAGVFRQSVSIRGWIPRSVLPCMR